MVPGGRLFLRAMCHVIMFAHLNLKFRHSVLRKTRVFKCQDEFLSRVKKAGVTTRKSMGKSKGKTCQIKICFVNPLKGSGAMLIEFNKNCNTKERS